MDSTLGNYSCPDCGCTIHGAHWTHCKRVNVPDVSFNPWPLGPLPIDKRTLLAGMAMQGILASHCSRRQGEEDFGEALVDFPDELATLAVKQADSLLAELAKQAEGK